MSSHRRAPQDTEGPDALSVFCGVLRWLKLFTHLKIAVGL